ncbi:hypothetical protein Btru_062084 [Bulinus truncatus]|nr:hypothetical protein Btru_062084 [Bulinus truncatus]
MDYTTSLVSLDQDWIVSLCQEIQHFDLDNYNFLKEILREFIPLADDHASTHCHKNKSSQCTVDIRKLIYDCLNGLSICSFNCITEILYLIFSRLHLNIQRRNLKECYDTREALCFNQSSSKDSFLFSIKKINTIFHKDILLNRRNKSFGRVKKSNNKEIIWYKKAGVGVIHEFALASLKFFSNNKHIISKDSTLQVVKSKQIINLESLKKIIQLITCSGEKSKRAEPRKNSKYFLPKLIRKYTQTFFACSNNLEKENKNTSVGLEKCKQAKKRVSLINIPQLVKVLDSDKHISSVSNINDCGENKDIPVIVEKFELVEDKDRDFHHLSDRENDTHINLISKKNGSKENKDISGGKEKSEAAILEELMSSRNIRINPEAVSVFIVDGVARHPPRLGAIEWSWLNEEKWRLLTFSKYPQNAPKSAILLATDGFAYIGCGKGLDDSVICFFCESTKNKWNQSDDITEVHKLLCPSCSMVTKINCTNVPLITENDSRLFDIVFNTPKVNNTKVNHNSEIEDDGAIPVNDDQLPDIEHDAEPCHPSKKPVAASSSSNTGYSFSRQTNRDVASFQQVNPNLSDSFSAPNSLASQLSVAHNDSSAVGQAATSTPHSATTVSSTSTIASSVSISSEPVTVATAAVSRSSNAVPPAPVASSVTTAQALETPVASASQSIATSQASLSMTSNATSQANSSSSQNTAKGGSTGPTYSELGIVTERPKRFEYALLPKRVETFGSWPRDHHLRPKELAEAGFYYAGYGDCARCFYCGGGLRNWEDEDDVWVEHARWFPKCAYIRQLMGQVFVDVVQELNKTNDQISFKMVTDKIGAAASAFQLDSKDNPLKRDPAVKTVVDMGFPIKEVIAVAENIKEDGNILSADKIYEKLKEGDISRSQTPARRSGLDTDGTESEANVARNLEKLRNLKEQNNQLRQQTVCKICMDKEVAVVFLPCGHFVSCTDCAAAMKDCPVCRNHVKGIVRAFMGIERERIGVTQAFTTVTSFVNCKVTNVTCVSVIRTLDLSGAVRVCTLATFVVKYAIMVLEGNGQEDKFHVARCVVGNKLALGDGFNRHPSRWYNLGDGFSRHPSRWYNLGDGFSRHPSRWYNLGDGFSRHPSSVYTILYKLMLNYSYKLMLNYSYTLMLNYSYTLMLNYSYKLI